MILDLNKRDHPNALSEDSFKSIFTPDKPVIFNFHGYPSLVRQLLFGRNDDQRFHVVS